MRKILFDLYGLFMKNQDSAGQRRIEQAARIADLGVTPANFWQTYRQERGGLDAGSSWNAYVTQIGQRLGVTFPDSDALYQADEESWMKQDDEMIAWLTELRQQGQVPALLSNIPATLLDTLRSSRSWLSNFDPALYSCEIGLAKPDAAIYTYAIERIGIPAADIFFLDDNVNNVCAARECGLNAEVFTSLEQAKAAVAEFLAGDMSA